MTPSERLERVRQILSEAKKLSREYYQLTGKPLGITGEVAEYEAAAKLGLELAVVRSPGFDAKRKSSEGVEELIQIKGRSYAQSKKSQRIGRLNFEKSWHSVILVILDETYELVEIYQATREAIERRLTALKDRPDGKPTHTKRGAVSVSLFKSIAGKAIWKR